MMNELLDAWFGAPGSSRFGQAQKQWFRRDAEFDAMLAARFGTAIERALAGEFAHWSSEPLGALAQIVLLDQLPRNCFRGTPRAFVGDPLALPLARMLVATGADRMLSTIHHRAFAYLPFEHDESPDSQREAVRLFTGLDEQVGGEADHGYLRSAIRHAEVIERFGRFPHRNAVLGRDTTAQEAVWLRRHGGF
jgi:uncharacterized protein (DUF924 family)